MRICQKRLIVCLASFKIKHPKIAKLGDTGLLITRRRSQRRSSSSGAHRPSPAAVLPEQPQQRRRPGGRGAAGGGKGRLNFLYSLCKIEALTYGKNLSKAIEIGL